MGFHWQFRPRPESTALRLTAILNVFALLIFYICVTSRPETSPSSDFDAVRLRAVLQKMAASDPSPLAVVKPCHATRLA